MSRRLPGEEAGKALEKKALRRVLAVLSERGGWVKGEDLGVTGLEATCA